MAFVHRKLWSYKPKQRGPAKAVSRDLYINAEQRGIDPARIALAMPMWNPGDQRDYAHGIISDSALNATYQKNGVYLNSGYIHMPDGLPKSDAFTMIVRASGDTPNTYLMGWGEAATNAGPHMGNYQVNGDLRFAVWGNGVIDQPFDFSGIYTIAGSKTGHSGRLYANGGLLGTGIINTSSQATSAGYIGALPNATNPWTGYIYSILFVTQQLSDSKIALLSDNPYALWQRVPPVSYFFQTAAPTGNRRRRLLIAS